jgi:hypothetical protein
MSTATWMSGEAGYIVVDRGGVLGLGTKHYYVPFDAVDDVAPGDCVTLKCTREECEPLFGQKPDML